LRVISQTTGSADLVEGAKLALSDAKAQVLRVSRVRHEKAFGTLFESIVLPLDKFPGLAHGESVPDITSLAQRFGFQIERVTELIRFVEAPGNVAQHLGIAPGTGVVKLDRITETSGGTPLEWRVAYAWKVA
jgi:DNA-binding GntR family transcriptional regulator